MTRQFLAVVVTATLLTFPGSALAQKGGGSHGSSHGSSAAKGGASSKPVHVKTYTKKDGTTVEAHDRKAPTPTAGAGTGTGAGGSSPIRVYRDPVSGRMTFTNAPPPTTAPLAARTTLPTSSRSIPPVGSAAKTAGRLTTTQRPRTAAVAAASKIAITGAAVPRSADGKIQRSAAARHAFARQTGYPNGRLGYVIDHIKPLACGGADAPSNMQWQTVAQAKAKDKIERVGCR